MGGANGDALEWALALMGTPAQRHALRQQPLPAGIERLLGIAGGSLPDDLASVLPQTIAHRLVPLGSASRGATEQVRAMVEATPLP